VATELSRRRALRQEAAEIGAGAAAIVLLLAGLAWASTGSRSTVSGGYLVSARFSAADGLTIGSPVQLAGVKVGAVTRLELDRAGMRPVVTMAITRGVRIPADSAILILSDGVLGGKYLRIEPGAEDRMLAAGEEFPTVQDSVIMEQILEKIVRGAEARRSPESSK
jgi:phospholipid/cholesterol/gamma-HCH transport system substrate-binding protein